jgi:hypothetical protein
MIRACRSGVSKRTGTANSVNNPSFFGESASNVFETLAEPMDEYGTKLRLPESLLTQMSLSVTERR